MTQSRSELEARLEQLVESDGDAAEIASVIATLDSMSDAPDVEVKEAVMSQISAEDLGMTPEESTPTSVSGITKEALGIGGEFTSVLSALSLDTIKAHLMDVEDTEDLMVLTIPGVSIIDPQHRIHVEERGEVRRASRGAGLRMVNGVQKGEIISPNGNKHYVEDGVCFGKVSSLQPDSFTGQMANIERTSACLGHLDYRNTGTQEKPKWQATGREFTRCQHQWALMFNSGYFISFSKKFYEDVVWVEIAQRVGDEAAREAAQAQIQIWRDNRQTNFETRKAFAQATSHAKNVMGIAEDALLPDVPEVLEYKLPDGRTLREGILDLKGASFVVEYDVPVNGAVTTQRVFAKNVAEIRSKMAPAFALAKVQGGAMTIQSVAPAA
jgi:hypothetical protein